MTKPHETVAALLRRASKHSGATPHEAHLSAVRATEIATLYGLGAPLIAHCRVAEFKAARRLQATTKGGYR